MNEYKFTYEYRELTETDIIEADGILAAVEIFVNEKKMPSSVITGIEFLN